MSPVEVRIPLDRVTTIHKKSYPNSGTISLSYILTGEVWGWLVDHLGEMAHSPTSLDDINFRWCWRKIKGDAVFTFANEDNAVLFKLTWGGQ